MHLLEPVAFSLRISRACQSCCSAHCPYSSIPSIHTGSSVDEVENHCSVWYVTQSCLSVRYNLKTASVLCWKFFQISSRWEGGGVTKADKRGIIRFILAGSLRRGPCRYSCVWMDWTMHLCLHCFRDRPNDASALGFYAHEASSNRSGTCYFIGCLLSQS